MNEQQRHHARIAEDLKRYIRDYCTSASGIPVTDFSGEGCHDAFLQLQQALGDLRDGNLGPSV